MCFASCDNFFFLKQNLVGYLLHKTQDGAKWNSAYMMVLLLEQFISDHGKGRS